MKVLVATSLLIFSLQGLANHHHHDKEMKEKWDKMSFEEAKKMKLEKLNMKSAMIEEAKNCTNQAKDKDGLKACWKNMREQKKEMKEKMKKK